MRQAGAVNSGYYSRQIGEYVRPDRGFALDSEFATESDSYPRFIRGVPFHADAFDSRRPGEPVDLELVPEPGNPHDSHAVAADYQGDRVGYLPAVDAAAWHDVIAAANRSGHAVWVHGSLEPFDFGEGELSRLVPKIRVPNRDCAVVLAERLGLVAQVRALVGALSPVLRQAFYDQTWRGFDRTLERELRAHAHLCPDLRWPARRRDRHRVPGLVGVIGCNLAREVREHGRQERNRQREAAREQRRVEQALQGEVRRREREETERVRGERDAAIRARLASGTRNVEIQREFTVSSGVVERIKRDLRGGKAFDRNAEQRRERMQRCADALRLQRAGLSRARIAAELGVRNETVKGLLRDAKFIEHPQSDSPRLELARAAAEARLAGQTKYQFAKCAEISEGRATEAWRDAAAVFTQYADHPAAP